MKDLMRPPTKHWADHETAVNDSPVAVNGLP